MNRRREGLRKVTSLTTQDPEDETYEPADTITGAIYSEEVTAMVSVDHSATLRKHTQADSKFAENRSPRT